MVDEDWVSAKETAEILGVNLNALRQLTWRKSLRWHKKVGKAVYYQRSEVLEYHAKRQARNQA